MPPAKETAAGAARKGMARARFRSAATCSRAHAWPRPRAPRGRCRARTKQQRGLDSFPACWSLPVRPSPAAQCEAYDASYQYGNRCARHSRGRQRARGICVEWLTGQGFAPPLDWSSRARRGTNLFARGRAVACTSPKSCHFRSTLRPISVRLPTSRCVACQLTPTTDKPPSQHKRTPTEVARAPRSAASVTTPAAASAATAAAAAAAAAAAGTGAAAAEMAPATAHPIQVAVRVRWSARVGPAGRAVFPACLPPLAGNSHRCRVHAAQHALLRRPPRRRIRRSALAIFRAVAVAAAAPVATGAVKWQCN
eukprot:363455-Chlamydomonas_euryale.AAC.8